MSGLTTKRLKGEDGSVVRVDQAKELAGRIPDRRELAVEILTRMNLDLRGAREIWHGPDDPTDPLEWLRASFEAVNNGRHQQFSLPARIDVVVPELLDVDGAEVSIIDTRGIDRPSACADLETLLEDPHAVSVLRTSFNDAPGTAIQHLGTAYPGGLSG